MEQTSRRSTGLVRGRTMTSAPTISDHLLHCESDRPTCLPRSSNSASEGSTFVDVRARQNIRDWRPVRSCHSHPAVAEDVRTLNLRIISQSSRVVGRVLKLRGLSSEEERRERTRHDAHDDEEDISKFFALSHYLECAPLPASEHALPLCREHMATLAAPRCPLFDCRHSPSIS